MMIIEILSLFMTLVLNYSWAEVHEYAPLPEKTKEESESKSKKTDFDEEGLSLSPGIKPLVGSRPKLRPNNYPYIQGMGPKLGLLWDFQDKEAGANVMEWPYLLGFFYLLPDRRQPQWEIAASVVSNSEGLLSVHKRVTINPYQPVRPFYSYGGMISIEGDKGFASIFHIDLYHLSAAGGIEYMIKDPMSLRASIEVGLGLERQFTIFNLGYSWGFN